ncbi:MAG: FAD-binding oxidoreductase [Candidatus Bathyarchaeia archaeon]
MSEIRVDKNRHEAIKKALESVLGEDYVSDDPAVLESYGKDASAHGILFGKAPEFVVLPGSAKEVQAVVKIANRFKAPFITGGQMYLSHCVPSAPGFITIDMKRMNRILEINEKDRYAVVEPLVTYAELQSEVQKRGLFIRTPFSGAVCSVIANHLFMGSTGLDWKFGFAPKNILAVEWILPTGEMVKLGSLGNPNSGWIWGEGPGPDLRGLLRGLFGVGAGLGIVTKMAVKLHPWPGPKDFSSCLRGPSPTVENAWAGGWKKEFRLPRERFRYYLIAYPNIESVLEAIREIGEAEIAASCQFYSAWFMCFEGTQSQKEFWETWKSNLYQTLGGIFGPNVPAYALVVQLVGFTSPKQVEYEEKVLRQIVEETGGKFVPEDSKVYYDWLVCGKMADFWRAAVPRISRPMGTHFPIRVPMESLDHVAKAYTYILSWLDYYVKRYGFPDSKNAVIGGIDFGHFANLETDIQFDQSDIEMLKIALKVAEDGLKDDMEKGFYAYAKTPEAHDFTGPLLSNYHILLEKVKRLLDPNNISNPPYPIKIKDSESR